MFDLHGVIWGHVMSKSVLGTSKLHSQKIYIDYTTNYYNLCGKYRLFRYCTVCCVFVKINKRL